MLFGKKKNKSSCIHKYKDFPWIISVKPTWETGEKMYVAVITEPYVCIHCGDRINKELARSDKCYFECDANKVARQMRRDYAQQSEDKAVVEDMINDTILVDRQYLKFYDMVKNGTIELPKLEL